MREDVANAVWKVASVESSERRKNPAPPFITSQLQQAAARRLGFAVRRTMQIAQRLYEGREIPGRGTVGLITYMRTDSTRVSQEALTAVREHIGAAFPKESLPESPRFFKSRRDTQDAHEAIRPTYLDLPPDEVAKHVAADEAKLYRLIWQRFVASQMAPAVYDTTSADITAGRAVYRASGSTLKFAGYLAAYGISDEDEEDTDKDTPKLPPLTAGRDVEARRGRAREEGDAAAAALQRGVARQVPRGERHRPPVDLRRDPAQDRGARATSTAGTAGSSRPPSGARSSSS